MKFIVTPTLAINPAHIGSAERYPKGDVNLHLALPLAAIAPGMYRGGASPAGASDHVQVHIPAGPDADAVWRAVSSL
ncbi:hypothetical protein [Gemmata sp.]|uniref:hypothetical protein n=1 Tax=Gemmata sp. TaxID=1914242 RepID=UPI003F6EFE02